MRHIVPLVMHELVEFVSLSNPLELCSDHFHARLCQPAGIIKDPSVWLDGAGPPPKYIFKNNGFDKLIYSTNLDPRDPFTGLQKHGHNHRD